MDILGNMSGDMTNLDATVEGIHQKGNKYETSSHIMSGQDGNETDADDRTTQVGDLGVEIVVKPIKKEFTELQQRIFDNENELLHIEKRFYQIVTKRAVELEGVTNDEELEIE